jgi:hypothetical protein
LVFFLPPKCLNRIARIKGSTQDRQNLGARKPKGLHRIAKAKGPKQDSQNLGVRKPKNLNRIDKIWEKENQRA